MYTNSVMSHRLLPCPILCIKELALYTVMRCLYITLLLWGDPLISNPNFLVFNNKYAIVLFWMLSIDIKNMSCTNKSVSSCIQKMHSKKRLFNTHVLSLLPGWHKFKLSCICYTEKYLLPLLLPWLSLSSNTEETDPTSVWQAFTMPNCLWMTHPWTVLCICPCIWPPSGRQRATGTWWHPR